jgi:trimethylamine--corrinoid protein Co-methyltransferase
MYIGNRYYAHAPVFETLNAHQREQIHFATLRVLAEKGLVLQHPAARELLRGHGALVEEERVYLSRELVEWALKRVPSGFTLYDRDGRAAILAEGRNVYFGSGSDTTLLFDYQTREGKRWSKQQVGEAVRIIDALPHLDFVMSMGLIDDVPAPMVTREQYAMMIRNTVKPHVAVCHNKEDLEDVLRMYAAVRGSKEALRQKPYAIVYNEPTSPLICTKDAIDKLLLCADYGMPATFATGGLAGGTTPITAAGAIVLSNAECLFGLTIQQCYRPGAPLLFGYCNSPLDMLTMQSDYATPLALTIQLGMCDMARYYNLPCWGEAGDSISKVCDEQSALEAAQLIQMSALAGCNIIHDVGYMNFGLGFSLEHLVICDEIIDRTKAVMEGVEVTEESLCLDSILAVKPGGDFLRDKVTRAQMRNLWRGGLSDFNSYSAWWGKGASSMGERAHEKVKKLLAEHMPPPLDPQVDAQIEVILQAAYAKLE